MNKYSAGQSVVQALQRWPAEKKIYASLRDAQIALHKNVPTASVETLQLRARAAERLQAGKNQQSFPLSDKTLFPDGNGRYYDTIKREAAEGTRSVGAVRTLKDSIFGWFGR